MRSQKLEGIIAGRAYLPEMSRFNASKYVISFIAKNQSVTFVIIWFLILEQKAIDFRTELSIYDDSVEIHMIFTQIADLVR